MATRALKACVGLDDAHIYALVEASTRDEALAAGTSAFDRLVGVAPDADAVFDSYVTFDETDVTGAGEGRWGERPAATPVEDRFGSLDDGVFTNI